MQSGEVFKVRRRIVGKGNMSAISGYLMLGLSFRILLVSRAWNLKVHATTPTSNQYIHLSIMGKCLTIVKLVGIGSLGLSSSAFLYSSWILPKLAENSSVAYSTLKEKVTTHITTLRISFWSLGSIASYLFYQAYTRSPSYGKHPYLIYAALSFPIALLYNYFFAFSAEQSLLNNEETKIIYHTEKRTVKEVEAPEQEKSPLDDSVYNDLGNNTPKVSEKEIEIQVPTESKVELAEVTYKSLLANVNENYLYTSGILGVGFVLSIIGYVGDNLK